jgi:hypothetical protein
MLGIERKVYVMGILKWMAVPVLAGATLTPAVMAPAQITVNIGPEPVCPYGYYDFAPYNCAPYGYYGPEWFNGANFIGVGPWFRGRDDFYGNVDNRYDPRHGYGGPFPERGDHPFNHFHGNGMRDGRGHEGGPRGGGHDGGHDGGHH